MRGAPQAGDAGGDAGERVGARGAGEPHGGGGGVLLVVGMQDQDAVERARDDRVHHVGLARHREAHLQEVRGVVEVVARIDEGLADGILVGHGGQRRHLGHQAVARDHALLRIVDVGGVVVEGRERADRAAHDGHGMRVAAEAGEEARHLLVHHGVARDGAAEVFELRLVRQLAVEQQVAHLDEVGVLRQLLDRVAAVEQHALVAVDVGDLGRAVGGRGEARIVGEAAGVAVEPADVDDVGPDGARSHRQMRLLVAAEASALRFLPASAASLAFIGLILHAASAVAPGRGPLQCATAQSDRPDRARRHSCLLVHFALRQDMPRAKTALHCVASCRAANRAP